MTTFTTQDREALEKGLDFFKELKGEEANAEPIPFAGWVTDADDKEKMLRDQLRMQQNEIGRLKQILLTNGIPS